MGKLAVIMLLVVMLAGMVSVSPSVDVSAQEPLTSTRITKDWGYEYTALTGDKIEVGDKTTTEFKPVLKLERWGGEAYIKVSLPTTEKISPTTAIEKVVWEGQTVDAHFYPLEPTEQYKLGGFEFEVILKEKPLTNKIVLDFETRNLKFYYQPPLTGEFASGWSDEFQCEILVTETTVTNLKTGDILVHRPENVVGSYAVYHATKRDHILGQTNYMVGKAFHIFRPKIIDARGIWAWSEQYIDPKAGKQIITIPQWFLDTATYPIRHAAGDTFGYTPEGGTPVALSANYIYLRGYSNTTDGAYSPASDGTGVSMSFYGSNSGDEVKMALYSRTNALVGTLIDSTGAVALDAGAAWKTANFVGSPSVFSATRYFLVHKSSAGITFNYDSVGEAGNIAQRFEASTFGDAFPNPCGLTDSAAIAMRVFSIYCTYTPSNGVVAPTVVTNAATSVEETTATLSGNITATGGENCTDRGFQWDIDTGAPYADNWTESGNFGVGNFTHGITGLTKGELYYYVAGANNTAGWSWGAEVTFLTKPDEPNTLVATGLSGQVNLTWNKGTGADNTTITAKLGSYPANRADGTVIYDNTGTSYSHTGLGDNEQWYYRAWSWCTEGGLEQYSDTYAQDNATTSGAPPALPSEILPEGIPAAIGVGHLAWFIPLVLFSVPAFWRRNALLFMLAAACSLMMGFYWYVLFTTNLGLSLGILLVGFGLVCLMFGLGCLFKRRRDSEE